MTRRIAGLLKARGGEARLWAVCDPRKPRGKRWKRLQVLLEAAMVGVVGGRRLAAGVADDLALDASSRAG